METDLNTLKDKHLSNKCSKHGMKINSVSILPDKSCRFLCKLCKDKVDGEKIQHLVDLLDDDITAVLEDKVQSEAETPSSIDDRYSAVFEKISGVFANLQNDFNQKIKQAEQDIKKKFVDFMEGSSAQGVGAKWADVKAEFMNNREKFIKSEPGKSSESIVNFVESYNSIMNKLAKGDQEKPGQEFEINTKVVDRLSESLDAHFKQIEQKFFTFKLSSSVSVNVSQIKEEGGNTLPTKGVFKAVASLEDHGLVAIGGTDGVLSILDVETMKVVNSFKPHRTFITGIEYIPSRNQLATSSLDRTVKVFNIVDGKISDNNSFSLTGHKSFIYGVKYLPDIDRLAVAGYEPELKLWNLDTKQCTGISTNGWASDSYEIMHIQDEGLIGLVGKDMIKIIDYNSKSIVSEIKTDGLSMNSIQYNKQTGCFYAAIQPGIIRVWEVNGKSISQKQDIKFDAIGETPYTLLSIDEQGMLVVTTRSKKICFVKVDDGSVTEKSTDLKDCIGCCVIRKKAKLILTDNQSNKIVVLALQ